MAKSLDALRLELANHVARLFTGTATGGTQTTIIDTAGLNRYAETDALKGGIAHIRTAGGAAPEGQWRWITAFNPTNDTITVDRQFTATVDSGDTYDLYLAPLTLEQWDLCVNRAINAAWPEVWQRDTYVIEDLIRAPGVYAMPAGCEEVLEIWAYPWTSTETADEAGGIQGQWVKWSDGFSPQRFPPATWRQEGIPGSSLNLQLLRQATRGGLKLHVFYKKRFTELAAGTATTDLDPSYILAAARAEWYQMMGDASRGQADRGAYLQLMNHWQEVAAERKRALGALLLGLPPLGEQRRRS